MDSNGDGVQSEKINTDIVTLTRFLTEEQGKHKEATGDFTYVFPILNSSIYRPIDSNTFEFVHILF